MSDNPYAPDFEDLPEIMPVFPLHGVLLLPKGQLPLNIFETCYLSMIEDAMRGRRMIGIVQPERPQSKKLYRTGCAGKITSYQETDDGRNLVTLTGICRFNICEELNTTTVYRQIVPDWKPFRGDLKKDGCTKIDRDRLVGLLKSYFEMHDLTCSWDHIDKAPDEKLITCLSMICPLEPTEKQVLLEAMTCTERGEKFLAMLEIAVKGRSGENCLGKCH